MAAEVKSFSDVIADAKGVVEPTVALAGDDATSEAVMVEMSVLATEKACLCTVRTPTVDPSEPAAVATRCCTHG